MSTSREIMADAKTRYRHTYDDPTVIGWLNSVHKRVYKVVPRDQLPETIILDGSGIYKIPAGIRRRWIKRVTMGQPGKKFKRLDFTSTSELMPSDSYTLAGDYIFIVEPEREDEDEYSNVLMIYYDKSIPTEITEDNLDDPPDLAEEYHEILTVGLLEMIAGARKDVKMKNNYNADYRELMGEFLEESSDDEPDYPSCRDELPRRARYGSMGD